ncbi:hypothetical protein D8Y24_04785 [Agrococcus lahaulensis]|uniref:hypothetical protein n=1 Tax=Agrococcus sp. SCSIO52902 TaxID=2933290 RepID=UPI000FE2C8A8|nr:hypothetical protein [Agrococcus sp. SCSIO52902]RWR24761.1 hypothetical protein D8Y24_04785 [Agrococcus lahaulensis]UOW01946.1 hypothetical protein MU522_05990 [Agrococcus sp. SCSIO52902]
MAGHDEDARRWAPPGHPAARGAGGGGAPEQPGTSAAAPWTRGARPTRRPDDASATSSVPVPAPPWDAPPEQGASGEREPRMWPIAAGIAGLAVLASIPHWVAPTIALMVSLVGIPIAWGFRRISHGRRRVQYVVVVLTLLLTAALAVIAPLLWLELGVLAPLTVPDVPAPE